MSDNKEKGFITELGKFFNNSKNFIENCEKPDRKGKKKLINWLIFIEFVKIAKQCSIGFLIMGAIGFVIKLIFLMINNILLS